MSAENDVLLLLQHWGIPTEGLRDVGIEAFVDDAVMVWVRYYIKGSTDPVEFDDRTYKIVEE